VSRKGKASPLEAGRGKHSPPANPIGDYRKPWSEGIMGSTKNGESPAMFALTQLPGL